MTERLTAEIAAVGPLRFSRFMDLALYERDGGFYERGGAAGGRRGDFITSVETGPLFAAMVGEWLDRRWDELGRPDPYEVVEAAAGVGTLWRGLRRAAPDCFTALHWTLAERSARLRATHEDLPHGNWESAAGLPERRVHAVLANELLDNLAFDIAELTRHGWHDVVVDRVDDRFVFTLGSRSLADLPDGGVQVGVRVPVVVDALDWIHRARDRADHVLVFDYGATTVELAARGIDGWLRTYADHGRGGDPLSEPGTADITHDVPFDQLPPPRRRRDQATWLRDHGLDERVARARQRWRDRSAIGDLEAMFARSAIAESEALTDPTGLGGFTVLEW